MTIQIDIRAAFIAVAAFFMFAAIASDANAQTRTFDCGKGMAITLNVLGPNAISAGPIEGSTMRLKKSPQNPMRFLDGDYAVTISPDQTRIVVEIPDWGQATCNFRPGSAAANQQGLGSSDPCGPGFQHVPGTRRCEPRPGNTPQPPRPGAQKRADDPCPANFMQAPETDRCDPAPGAPAPRQVAAGSGKLPVEGRSLGGIMRAGPSQSTPKVMSTGEGNELMILTRGPMWDGYNWFQVQYQGRLGWIWGGIMCSSAPLGGIYEQCAP